MIILCKGIFSLSNWDLRNKKSEFGSCLIFSERVVNRSALIKPQLTFYLSSRSFWLSIGVHIISGLPIIPLFALVMSIIRIYFYRSELYLKMICHISAHSCSPHAFVLVLPEIGAYTSQKRVKVYAYFMTNKLNIARSLAWWSIKLACLPTLTS